MEIRSFLAGMFFLLGLELLMPLLSVKVNVSMPYAPVSTLIAAIVALVLAYYLFRGN